MIFVVDVVVVFTSFLSDGTYTDRYWGTRYGVLGYQVRGTGVPGTGYWDPVALATLACFRLSLATCELLVVPRYKKYYI